MGQASGWGRRGTLNHDDELPVRLCQPKDSMSERGMQESRGWMSPETARSLSDMR